MHLRESQLLSDHVLAQIQVVPQRDHASLAAGEPMERCGDDRPVDAALELALAVRILEPELVSSEVSRLLRGRAADQDLLEIPLREPGRGRELGGGGSPLELRGQGPAARLDERCSLLRIAREPDGPGPVAQVAPDLARHGESGVGAEVDAIARVEAIDRLDQSDRADLNQVLEWLARARESSRDRFDERQMSCDQLLAGLVASFHHVHSPLRVDYKRRQIQRKDHIAFAEFGKEKQKEMTDWNAVWVFI